MLKSAVGLAAGFISFAVLVFVINPIQMMTAPLYPFWKKGVRAINRRLAQSIWGFWVLMAELHNDIRIRFTGDPFRGGENALLLANHQGMADVLALLCFAWRCRRIGDLKWFVKDIVKYVPGPGWGMHFIDCVFLKRDWTRDRAGILRLFQKYKTGDIPLILVSFLEGTRRTPEKLERAKAYARELGLPEPMHTLVPRTKGFTATMMGLRDHLDAVYDVTIGYPEGVPALFHCFSARLRRVEVHYRRYPIEDMPEDEDALRAWAIARFQEKDARLQALSEGRGFEGAEHHETVRVRDWFSFARREPELDTALEAESSSRN